MGRDNFQIRVLHLLGLLWVVVAMSPSLSTRERRGKMVAPWDTTELRGSQ